MYVLHSNWMDRTLCLWAESDQRWIALSPCTTRAAAEQQAHPFAASQAELTELIRSLVPGVRIVARPALEIRIPIVRSAAKGEAPQPSTRLAHAAGHTADDEIVGFAWRSVACVAVERADTLPVLERLEEMGTGPDGNGRTVHLGQSVAFFAMAGRLARHLMAQHRFVPMLVQADGSRTRGAWAPWLSDDMTAARVLKLVRAMPPVVRAARAGTDQDALGIVEDFLLRVLDAECRKALIAENLADAIASRDPSGDQHVAWLGGLLSDDDGVPSEGAQGLELVRGVRRWIGGLDDRGADSEWRLCLVLEEPDGLESLGDLHAPGEDVLWRLCFHLQSVEDPGILLEAEEIWMLPSDSLAVEGRRVDSPQELLLAELGRASRVSKEVERALREPEPTGLALSTREAYRFLRESRPVLLEQGIGAIVPDWWESPATRLGARLRLTGDDEGAPGGSASMSGAGSRLGLGAMVRYDWQIAVGETVLTLEEFEELAQRRAPLVRVGGRWAEIRPEDVQAALRFVRENPGGWMKVSEALRLAYASDVRETGVPVTGLDAGGWVASLIGGAADDRGGLPELEVPAGFRGELRPYQLLGLRWLVFLERHGLGACLADDMGLGKTIQVLALLQREKELAESAGPTLLVVPMSVVGNWEHEAGRFTPELRILVHHGPERAQGEALRDMVCSYDAVITTYALANRDRESLEMIPWGRIVLDEAQYIKNPSAKQTQAIRELIAERRTALTGTPVENRLTELWSIMEFLNPGFLGPLGGFSRRFAVPIERYHDPARGEQLRGLVRPFVLRRLKTDPHIIGDLPEKVETREYCHLTPEQARLYESTVRKMLGRIDNVAGMQRRGMVLAALVRLKQICNHPAQLLHDYDVRSGAVPAAARSGKCIRLTEMLSEVLASGDQALVFTQFRQMGILLLAMLAHDLDREVMFLHGGTPKTKREEMVRRFQRADGSAPILLVSLKAGGVGLNLTAGTHVFHFDRWWNPAVESQATDRAYRIGQTRAVQVHKFVVSGTLEERIDQMLTEKSKLAERIIGAGERWLTELSTDRLRELLTLRAGAVGDEE